LMGPTQGTKQREREQEEEHLLVHLESSWLEMRSRDHFLLIRKNKEPREGSQAGRREVQIIHHREGLYPKVTINPETSAGSVNVEATARRN